MKLSIKFNHKMIKYFLSDKEYLRRKMWKKV